MEWTKEQKAAIDIRGDKSILLSAAAGSGKTAVLVERIISRIKDKNNPLSVSSLLALTFTEAAASEMKRKISHALRRELEENPQNEYLRRQSMLLPSAQISTVHAFLNRLISGNIHLFDLPADFSLASEAEADLLLNRASDRAFEKYYQRIDRLSSFKELTESYGGAKSDFKLRELVKKLFLFTKSLPYPVEWLKNSVNSYKTFYLEKDIKNTPWQAFKEAEASAVSTEILSLCDMILNVLSHLPENHKYQGFYLAETELVKETLKSFLNGDKTALKEFKFPAKVRKQNTHPEEESKADSLRELIKTDFEKLKALVNSETPESCELSEKLYLRAKTLKNLVLLTDRIYKKLKAERSLLDFSDLEHEALKLLADKDRGPSPHALELRARYEEIFLDEYQDTNGVQEEIFRLISRDGKNLFMVGDLKQSIYKFRNALPELFAEKRRIYKNDGENGTLLSLNKNFRSRRCVTEAVNFIFSRLMSEALGGTEYKAGEFLIKGADYPDEEKGGVFDTEFYIIKGGAEEKLTEDELKEAEAKAVADRIKELISDGFMIYDKNEEKMKEASYSDIVILLRSRTMAPLFETALFEAGIPCVSDKGGGCLASFEVQTVISFLNIIDNPLNDIPLIAVLRSDIFGFTPDELAAVRLKNKNGLFYDALLKAAEDGDKKSADFLKELDSLRKEAEKSGIYRLILTIYERYSLMAMTGGMEFPEIRRLNLKLFLQAAAEFEKTEKSGLFAFMNYIERLKAEDRDIVSAKGAGKNENAVRIMTVHNSKGLEFPIVFFSDTSHKFNLTDASQDINFHHEAGLSLAAVDDEERIKYPSLPSYLMHEVKIRELLSEEMRLLYVALTRAKEKLIITFRPASAARMKSWLFDTEEKPLYAQLSRSPSCGDWIFAAILSHPSAKALREMYGYSENIVCNDFDFSLKTRVINVCKEQEEPEEESTESLKSEEDLQQDINTLQNALTLDEKENIEKILSYKAADDSKIPLKITVSELKRQLAGEEESVFSLADAKNIHLKEKEELTAAEKGTITHFVLQHLDEKMIKTEDDLLTALAEAVEDGVITETQKEALDTEKLTLFYKSGLAGRLKKSKRVYKEYSFYAPADADAIFKEEKTLFSKEDKVLLQGTIDCFFFEEDGNIILIDYKTDAVRTKEEAAERAENYKIQLDCYNFALKTVFGKEAGEGYIYFLNCNEAVRMF